MCIRDRAHFMNSLRNLICAGSSAGKSRKATVSFENVQMRGNCSAVLRRRLRTSAVTSATRARDRRPLLRAAEALPTAPPA
eukprot:8457130-Alexandrium_andersonii.AAC.1